MSKKQIYDSVVMLAGAFQTDINQQVATLYTERLARFDLKEIQRAINIAIDTKKFFPKVAELIEIIEPPVAEIDNAQIMANNIIEVVLSLGRYQATEINDRLTPEERYALIGIGGIEAICNIQNEQLGTVRAQLRNSCKAAIVKGKIELQQVRQLENRRGMKKLDFGGYEQ
jgi:hypothetical protein